MLTHFSFVNKLFIDNNTSQKFYNSSLSHINSCRYVFRKKYHKKIMSFKMIDQQIDRLITNVIMSYVVR